MIITTIDFKTPILGKTQYSSQCNTIKEAIDKFHNLLNELTEQEPAIYNIIKEIHIFPEDSENMEKIS